MIVGAIGHEVSPATPVMPVLRAYRACASPTIVLKPLSTKTRRHELFSGAVAVKAALFNHCRPANPRGSCAVCVSLGTTQTIANFLRALPHHTAIYRCLRLQQAVSHAYGPHTHAHTYGCRCGTLLSEARRVKLYIGRLKLTTFDQSTRRPKLVVKKSENISKVS